MYALFIRKKEKIAATFTFGNPPTRFAKGTWDSGLHRLVCIDYQLIGQHYQFAFKFESRKTPTFGNPPTRFAKGKDGVLPPIGQGQTIIPRGNRIHRIIIVNIVTQHISQIRHASPQGQFLEGIARC